jgi:hypothetical protein
LVDNEVMPVAPRRITFLRIAAFCSLVGAYIVLVTMILRVDEFILKPNHANVDAHGAVRRLIDVESGKVEVFRLPPKSGGKPRAYLLYFSGNAARAESSVIEVAGLWPSEDVETWCMNYPGSGQSTGDAQIAELAPAAIAAFDELHRQAAGRPIYVSGNCLGATVALHVAANRRVEGIVLQNPAPLRQLVRNRFRGPVLWFLAYPVSFQVPSELDAMTNATRCTAPAIFIRSIHDESIPPQLQKPIFDAYAGKKRLLKLDGDHTATPDAAGNELKAALDWLEHGDSMADSR